MSHENAIKTLIDLRDWWEIHKRLQEAVREILVFGTAYPAQRFLRFAVKYNIL